MNQPDPTASDKPGEISPRLVIAAVVTVLLVIFILQNTQKVNIRFLIFSFSSPLWLILVIVAVLAALLDDVVLRAARRKKSPQ